ADGTVFVMASPDKLARAGRDDLLVFDLTDLGQPIEATTVEHLSTFSAEQGHRYILDPNLITGPLLLAFEAPNVLDLAVVLGPSHDATVRLSAEQGSATGPFTASQSPGPVSSSPGNFLEQAADLSSSATNSSASLGGGE